MKIALDKLKKLAKSEDKEGVAEDARTDAEQEGYKDGFNDVKGDVKDALSKMKVSELKAKIRENILSTLNEADEEVDVNKILSNGGYDIIDDEKLLMTVKSRLKGNSNIDAKKLNLLVMKIEDEEGGNIDFSEGKLSEMAYERDSVEDIVKRIKPILANHPQLKTLEDPDQYLIDFVTKRKKFLNKNEAPIDKDKFTYNVGTTPYDEYINLQFNKYIYSNLTENKLLKEDSNSIVNLLMKNQREVAKKLNYMEYFPFDEVNIDLEGDASIVLQDEAGGLSFRYPEDVDSKFVGQNGDKPRPVTIGGVDLMYIGYNI